MKRNNDNMAGIEKVSFVGNLGPHHTSYNQPRKQKTQNNFRCNHSVPSPPPFQIIRATAHPNNTRVAMEEITKLLGSMPKSIQIVICGMLGLQVLAFSAWFIMMMRESKNEKEKQSWGFDCNNRTHISVLWVEGSALKETYLIYTFEKYEIGWCELICIRSLGYISGREIHVCIMRFLTNQSNSYCVCNLLVKKSVKRIFNWTFFRCVPSFHKTHSLSAVYVLLFHPIFTKCATKTSTPPPHYPILSTYYVLPKELNVQNKYHKHTRGNNWTILIQHCLPR